MKKCVIISAGKSDGYDILKDEVKDAQLIICADAGIVHAENAGIVPDIILGDFDSYSGDLDKHSNVIKLPVEKDDTDTMYAVKLALKKGCDEFVLFGALGGRLDHTIANIQTLKFLQLNNAFGRIVSENNIVFLLSTSSIAVKKKEGFKLSVFAYGDKCRGVTLKNVHYPLDNYTLDNTFPLGVSNEFEGEEAFISVDEGDLLILLSKDSL